MSACVRCGKETTGGSTYCRECHGWQETVKALLATAEGDAELLGKASSMSNAALARDLGVSRAAVGQRLARARQRQEQRAGLEFELTEGAGE
jgi:hypothetical protein